MRWPRGVALLLGLLALGPLLSAFGGNVRLGQDWRTADRSPAGIAPDPARTPEAVVLAYSARAFNWRGIFAVHTWLATKRAGADHYVVHQVVGWRKWRGLPVVVSHPDVPDRLWFGARPEVLAEVRGPRAEALIPAIERAVARYPYPEQYRVWPGPNSNTFTAWVAREVPELRLELPVTAIGKDYLADGALVARAPSGTGLQISAFGLLGATVARYEGLELNLLGLVIGLDPAGPAVKLPGVGRLGPDLDAPPTRPASR